MNEWPLQSRIGGVISNGWVSVQAADSRGVDLHVAPGGSEKSEEREGL